LVGVQTRLSKVKHVGKSTTQAHIKDSHFPIHHDYASSGIEMELKKKKDLKRHGSGSRQGLDENFHSIDDIIQSNADRFSQSMMTKTRKTID